MMNISLFVGLFDVVRHGFMKRRSMIMRFDVGTDAKSKLFFK